MSRELLSGNDACDKIIDHATHITFNGSGFPCGQVAGIVSGRIEREWRFSWIF